MFRSRERNPEQRLDEFVARAKAAHDAGTRCFQVYLPDSDAAAADYETASLVEMLEGEGWTLENIGHAVEPPDESAAAIETPGKVVGTIYTFRAA